MESSIATRPPAPPLSPPSHRVDWLLLVRGMACIMVIISHCWRPYFKQMSGVLVVFGHDWTWLIGGVADPGVWIFFTLSGYLMGKAFWSGRYALTLRGARQFYRNRLLRIAPLYYISTLLLVCLVPHILHDGDGLLPLLCFVGQHSNQVNGPALINGPLWSISTEMQFYALVPLLALCCLPYVSKLRAILPLLVGVMLAATALAYVTSHGHAPTEYPSQIWWDDIFTPLRYNIAIFFTGFLMNPLILRLRARFGVPRPAPPAVLIVLIAVLYVTSAWLAVPYFARGTNIHNLEVYWIAIPIALLTALIIVVSESPAYTLRRVPMSWPALQTNPARALEWFGILSYGMYIWHARVLDALTLTPASLHLPHEIFLWKFPRTLAATFLLALVTYVLIEKPFERLKGFGKVAPARAVNAREERDEFTGETG